MTRIFANEYDEPSFESGVVSFGVSDVDVLGNEIPVARVVMREADFIAMIDAYSDAIDRAEQRRGWDGDERRSSGAPFASPPPRSSRRHAAEPTRELAPPVRLLEQS